MKKAVTFLICFCLLSTFGFSSDDSYAQQSAQLQAKGAKTSGQAAAAGSESSVSLSMVIWGVGLAVGIGLLAGFLNSSTSATHAHSK